MNSRDYVRGSKPDRIHTEKLILETSKILERRTEAVIRHYVENCDECGIPIELCDRILPVPFAFRKLSQSAKTEMVMSPVFQYWLKAARRCTDSNYSSQRLDVLEQLPSVGWMTLALEGILDFPLVTKLDSLGGLRCSPIGSFIEFGAHSAAMVCQIDPVADGEVRVEVSGNERRFSVSDLAHGKEKTGVYNPPHLIGGIELSSRDDFLCAAFTGTLQRHDGVEFFGVAREQYQATPDIGVYDKAIEIAQSTWEDGFEEIRAFTNVVVPRVGTPEEHICFTVSSRQGAIFLDPLDPIELIENIVHETAHVKLRCIQFFDPIIKDTEDDERRFKVAWRKDKRPLTGILEGCYVFMHVAEIVRALNEKGIKETYSNLEQLKIDVGSAISVLTENATFTELGNDFIHDLLGWRDEVFP